MRLRRFRSQYSAEFSFIKARELNAFAVGEDHARNIGVDVKKTKLTVLICVSALIGVCVSIGGTIAFVGLVTPHAARFIAGPNHRRLLSASAFLRGRYSLCCAILPRARC